MADVAKPMESLQVQLMVTNETGLQHAAQNLCVYP